MRVHSFEDKLAFSKEVVASTAEDVILQMLTGCVKVEAASLRDDRKGIDWWATLRGGARVRIDQKTRDVGASRFWRNGPELALEIWSVVGDGQHEARTGWTLDEAKETDYVLYTFDPSDSQDAFLLPFQLLRVAFRKHFVTWTERFDRKYQSSGGWKSEAVFVPAWCVLDAIKEVSSTDDVEPWLFT